jgi:type VI secretion system protein ImpC
MKSYLRSLDNASTEPMRAPAKPDPGMPFQIAVLGDFSGRANRGVVETGAKLSGRKPIRIDRDNFDEVMARLNVGLRLPVPGDDQAGVVLQFKELDDFHPDRIFAHSPVFQSLKETRRKLNNPKTFESTAAALRAQAGPAPEPPPAPAATPIPTAPAAPLPANEDLLAQILGAAQVRAPEPAREADPWNALMREIVAPYVVAKTDPRQPELVASVDETTSRLLRKILHHPDFQALEAAWRGLFFLVRRLETDSQLGVFLIDMSKDELAADLTSADDPRATATSKLLVDPTVNTPGGKPWAVLALDATFGPTEVDVEILGRLATIARFAGAPVLAGASPHAAGCDSFAETPDPDDWQRPLSASEREAWTALRRHHDAPYLGLALPRFLLRLPYGKKDSPIESFAFEELTADSKHDEYLWGNPAFALVELLGRSFRASGWNLRPGRIDEIDGLPVHVRRFNGDSEAKPCAEAILSHRAAETLLERGLIPVLSVQNRDAIRLGGFLSVAEGSKPLAGRWRLS